MTNNKSECECKNSCSCHHPSDCECNNQCFLDGCPCPCHLGDTLKKQEEKNTNSLVTINSEKDVNKHESEDRDLRKVISKILVKWGMPTRQIAITEIEALISKSYQRGREEGLLEGYSRNDTLSIAVQEIEKLRMSPTVCEINDRGHGFNQGLDKAIEIINKVANLKK